MPPWPVYDLRRGRTAAVMEAVSVRVMGGGWRLQRGCARRMCLTVNLSCTKYNPAIPYHYHTRLPLLSLILQKLMIEKRK